MAHLRMYLGIALSALRPNTPCGGGWQTLHGQEAALTALGVALVGSALGVLQVAR